MKRDRRTLFWLIVDEEEPGVRPLSVYLPGKGEGALAAFSFEEETRMYLLLRAPKGRWRLKETRPEELASLLLSGACSGTERVALDPIGESWAREANYYLLSMSRESFLDHLLAIEPPQSTLGSSVAGHYRDAGKRR